MDIVCTQCGGKLKNIPAGVSKKTGKPYNAFIACENGCKQNSTPAYQNRNSGANNVSRNDLNTPLKIISDELGAINKRLDKLAKFLVDHLETPEERQGRLGNIKDVEF